MSQLAPDVKDAVVQVAATAVPGGLPPGRWSGLSEVVRGLIYAKVAERLLQVDSGTVSAALIEALADGQLTRDDIQGALLTAAMERAGGSEAAQLLREVLDAGPLNRDTAIRVIVAWGQSRIQDETLRSLFADLTGILGSGPSISAGEVLGRVLRANGIDPALAERVFEAVQDRRLDASEVVFLLATLAAAAGGTASLAGAGTPLARAEAVLQAGLPKGAEGFLQKMVDENWLGVVSALLGTLEAGVGGSLLRQLLGGRLRDLAVTRLTQLLERFGLSQTGAVANAIVDIATGARSLFAEGEESDSGLQTAAEISLLREIRQVLYIAQLATFGGPIVPTGAMDRPHIFAAAAIRFRTPLSDLIPDGADDNAKRLFCVNVTDFLDRHFRSRIRPFQPGPLAIDLNDIRAGGNRVRIVFVKVRGRLLAA